MNTLDIQDWEIDKFNVMRWVIRAKLERNRQLITELLNETEDKPIVEDSNYDDLWGASPILKMNTLQGRNFLGRMWMELRDHVNESSPKRHSGYWKMKLGPETLGMLAQS